MIKRYQKIKNLAIDFYHKQEPPDLEEIWINISNKFRNMFNDKIKKDSYSNRPNKNIISIIIIIVFFLWFISGFFIVQEGKVAVLTRFGKYIGTSQAGINWRFPHPIESHEIVNISRLRTLEIGYRGSSSNKMLTESLMLTTDENIVDMQFVVQYRLRYDGAPDYLFKISDPDDSVRQAAETAMREIVGKKTMDFVLYEGRTTVALEVQKLMQHILNNYRTGIQIDTVAIQNVQPPEQVQAAFDDAVKAGQDRERQINEGYAYANNIIPLAGGQASRLIEQAEGYKTKIIEEAKGNSSRFDSILKEYEKKPDITRSRIYLETMEEIFSNSEKIIIDSDNSTLILPTDRKNKNQVNKSLTEKTLLNQIKSNSMTDNNTIKDSYLEDKHINSFDKSSKNLTRQR